MCLGFTVSQNTFPCVGILRFSSESITSSMVWLFGCCHDTKWPNEDNKVGSVIMYLWCWLNPKHLGHVYTWHWRPFWVTWSQVYNSKYRREYYPTCIEDALRSEVVLNCLLVLHNQKYVLTRVILKCKTTRRSHKNRQTHTERADWCLAAALPSCCTGAKLTKGILWHHLIIFNLFNVFPWLILQYGFFLEQ